MGQIQNLLRACPHHGFTELHQLDTFYNALNRTEQDSLNSAAGGNLLERHTQDVLKIIENKSKGIPQDNIDDKGYWDSGCSRHMTSNISYLSEYEPFNGRYVSFGHGRGKITAKLTHAVNQQTSAVTTAMTAFLKQFQETPPLALVKVVEEMCVTCGGAHPYYQCLVADGNTFPEFQDNIQGYVSAAAINYIRDTSYQAPIQQNQVVPLSSGPLPSNTIANPKGELKSITTRSGLVLDGPSINPEEDERVEETLTDPDLAEYTIKYQNMLNALLSNKEKLLELTNTPLNKNCLAVILKNLPEKLGDPGKFLIPCGFSELKCKALADIGTSINLMPLSVWKKLGLPELISTRMTLELANRVICAPAGIARDVFVLVGKFTFLANFVIVDYESDPRVPLILGRPFLRIACALIDVYGEEMILRDEVINPLSGETTSSSPDHLLEEFADELALITFLPGNDDLPFDIESDLREIEYLLNHDPTKEMYCILEDPSDNDDVYDDPFDSKEDKIKESKLLIDELDPPRSSDFLPSLEYDSFLFEDFSKDFNPPLYELPFLKEVPGSETLLSFSSENKEKVFKPGILTSKGVHTSLLPKLSHRGPKDFKVIKNL
nr:reverse transcriptase domain-containing protein [Tanacetum cinerariifolium]